ncbi:hypothetical protein [Brevundimonas olei]|uniref:hypothetical protein n=1 Tax=Brevundimonas olei TaxID=657642 RepID=UPI0031D8D850
MTTFNELFPDGDVRRLANDTIKVKAYGSNPFRTAGLVQTSDEYNARVAQKGNIVSVPMLMPLAVGSQVQSDTGNPITPKKLAGDEVVAVKTRRSDAFVYADLAQRVSGHDLEGHILSQLGENVGLDEAAILARKLNALRGINDAAMHFGSDTAGMDLAMIYDAEDSKEENASMLDTIIMHPRQRNYLKKQNLIETVADTDQKSKIEYYGDKRVIVSSLMPNISGNVYGSILIGAGAIGLGEANFFTGSEGSILAHNGGGAETVLWRRDLLVNVFGYGVKLAANAIGTGGMTDAQIGAQASYERVIADHKLVPLAFIKANVAPAPAGGGA